MTSKPNHHATFSDIDHWLAKYLHSEGITHFAFTYYSQRRNSHYVLKHSYTSKAYRSWNQYYHSEKQVDFDSNMQEVYQSCMPIYWNCHQQLEDATTEKERNMRLDSIEYGAEEGLSIPTHGPNSDFGTLVIVKMKGQTFMNHWESKQKNWLEVALIYFNQIRKIFSTTSKKQGKVALTSRQIECLKLTAKNYHIQQISNKLAISVRTINYHLHKANKILGARNKHQAITKAISLGIIPADETN